MSNLKNLVCSKIPLDWFTIPEEKGGGKGKRIELSPLKDGGGAVIYYTIKTRWPEGYELSKAFDEALVGAIKAMENKRIDKIVVKNVSVAFKGKQWMYPTDGCEVITINAKNMKPSFHKKVTGKNPDKVQEQPEQGQNGLESEQVVQESVNVVDKIMAEAFGAEMNTEPGTGNFMVQVPSERSLETGL